MPAEQDIAQILNSGRANVRGGSGRTELSSGRVVPDITNRVDEISWDGEIEINTAANTINFRLLPLGIPGADSIIVGNQTGQAATGQLQPPGFIFSDYFSGCIFFLFRDQAGNVYGVHSYRASGHYANPIPYFNQRNGKLLYYFESGAHFTSMGPNIFGSVICNVSATRIVIDFFGRREDGSVVRLVDHTVIDNWATHEIPDPGILGALGQYHYVSNVPPTPPAKMGLKKRVRNFFLDYIK
jgi:hypothetical protein